MSKNDVEKQLAYESLQKLLPELTTQAKHSELWGYDLAQIDATVTERLLRKFLQANNYEIDGAKGQLLKTLKWRKKFKPLSAAFKETHASHFDSLGVVTTTGPKHTVITWNIYGAVKDRQSVFGDVDAFLRWRVGLMERAIAKLDFSAPQSSYMHQIHDYAGVSFFNMDSHTRATTQKTIATFQDYYPELLDKKYFVNVPRIMGWVFALVKPLVSKETIAKFKVLSNGKELGAKLGDWVPKTYGGNGAPLEELGTKGIGPTNPDLLEAEARAAPEGAAAPEKSAEATAVEPADEVPVTTETKAANGEASQESEIEPNAAAEKANEAAGEKPTEAAEDVKA